MQKNSTENPTIAVTLGDPAGIGPEIVAKAFSEEVFAGGDFARGRVTPWSGRRRPRPR